MEKKWEAFPVKMENCEKKVGSISCKNGALKTKWEGVPVKLEHCGKKWEVFPVKIEHCQKRVLTV